MPGGWSRSQAPAALRVGGHGHEPHAAGRLAQHRLEDLAALVVQRGSQVVAVVVQDIEGDQRGRRLAGQLRGARGGGVAQALLQRGEVHAAAGGDDELAVEDEPRWQEARGRDDLGEVAAERLGASAVEAHVAELADREQAAEAVELGLVGPRPFGRQDVDRPRQHHRDLLDHRRSLTEGRRPVPPVAGGLTPNETSAPRCGLATRASSAGRVVPAAMDAARAMGLQRIVGLVPARALVAGGQRTAELRRRLTDRVVHEALRGRAACSHTRGEVGRSRQSSARVSSRAPTASADSRSRPANPPGPRSRTTAAASTICSASSRRCSRRRSSAG